MIGLCLFGLVLSILVSLGWELNAHPHGLLASLLGATGFSITGGLVMMFAIRRSIPGSVLTAGGEDLSRS